MYQQTIAPPPPFPAQPFAGQTPLAGQPPFAGASPFAAPPPFPPAPGFGPGPGMPPQGFGPGLPPFPPVGGKSNQKLFIGIGAGVAVIALALILWLTGAFGGGNSWIQGRWCSADGVQLTFTPDGKVTSNANPMQPSTYTLTGTTLTMTAPNGQSGTFTVTKTDSNTMSFGSGAQAAPLRRC